MNQKKVKPHQTFTKGKILYAENQTRISQYYTK